MQSPLHILFLDDHNGVRDSIARLLSERNKHFVFHHAETREAAQEVLFKTPEISLALVDLNLNGADGLEAVSAFRKTRETLLVIVFTMYADPLHVEAALGAGVQGYVTKSASIEELESAILAVTAGGTYYDRTAAKIMQSLLAPPHEQNDTRPYMNYHSLTKKEQEVFALLAQKKDTKEIAQLLRKSEKTVINQRSLIYQKLDIRDRLDLIEYAKTLGVIV